MIKASKAFSNHVIILVERRPNFILSQQKLNIIINGSILDIQWNSTQYCN